MVRGFEKISFPQYKNDNLDIEYYDKYSLPVRATTNSAGYDFFALNDYIIKPGDIIRIPTGIKVYMQNDEVLLIFIRSSLGFKYNMRMCNQVGVIDSDYYNNESNEGHIWICLKNEGDKEVKIKRGEHFAQGVFTKFLKVDNDATVTSRTGGFGSTNKGGN